MMMRPPLTSLLLGVVALSGCSDSPGNPKVLWLGPDQNETHVKLVESEPPPF
jgi:hypothetical protein